LMQSGRGRQYMVAVALGVMPGCLGAYLGVSMYIHGVIGIGGMVAAAVASAGDEAFVMLALFPEKALLLMGVLAVTGVAGGALADVLADRAGIRPCERCEEHRVHDHPDCRVLTRREWLSQLARPDWRRIVLFLFFVAAVVLTVTGVVGPHGKTGFKILLVSVFVVGLAISLTVPDNYLREHIVSHLVRRHLPVVAAWTVGTLVALALVTRFGNLQQWIQDHRPWVLLTAVVVGLAPSSGPHMVFVALFAAGTLPFSALLANSVVQDGHGLLPLMATSVRDVALIKGYKAVLALAVAGALMAAGL